MKKYDEGVRISIDETVNIAEKVAVFLNPGSKSQNEAVFCVKRICKNDNYNAIIFDRFMKTYGNVSFTYIMGKEKNSTTLNRELIQFPEVMEIVSKAKIIT